MSKPLKFYQTLNQAPRSAKHGQHRRASPKAYGDTAIRTDYSAGGSDQGGTVTVSWSGASWISFGPVHPIPDPAPSAIPYAGIRTGEIIGHRLWWVIGPDLYSLAHKRPWLPNETVEGDVSKPVNNDALFMSTIWGGTYAFGSPESVIGELAYWRETIKEWQDALNAGLFAYSVIGWNPLEDTQLLVSGTIKMWGEVVEHERGYRAQFAKLNSIDAMHGDGDIDALRQRYGV